MGSNIDIRKFKSWLERNHWKILRTNKHETWEFYVFDKNNNVIALGRQTFSFHRSKGVGVSYNDISETAKIMKTSKDKLVEMVRNNEKFSIEHYTK